MDIIDEIVARKRVDLELEKQTLPPAQLYQQVEDIMAGANTANRSMSGVLAASDTGIIAEFKRRSPSKGWIHRDAVPETVVPGYAAAGASALSILTDEPYFGGSLDYIRRVRSLVDIPILRKDFIIDEYQLFQAKAVGADAVLLIAADLTVDQCRVLAATAHQLGLETLLEIHSENELDYISDNIDMVGVNNRNLGTFHVDTENSVRLADKLPAGLVKVSESGISRPQAIIALRQKGYRGFLIGETFMKQPSPADALAGFIADIVGLSV